MLILLFIQELNGLQEQGKSYFYSKIETSRHFSLDFGSFMLAGYEFAAG